MGTGTGATLGQAERQRIHVEDYAVQIAPTQTEVTRFVAGAVQEHRAFADHPDQHRALGDEVSAHAAHRSFAHPIVLSSPSSSPTLGSQPRTRRANAMSGHRCSGSSTGRSVKTISDEPCAADRTRSAIWRTLTSSGSRG